MTTRCILSVGCVLPRVARCHASTFGAALLTAVLGGPVYAEVANPYGVAVIIGNRSYAHERVPEVAYAHRDADAFRRFVLEVLGFDPDNIIDLRDASQAEMETALGNDRSPQGLVWRYLDTQEGSDVVVFYSGHGVPGLKDKRGYLLPVNANPDTAEINGYPIDVLYANLGKLEDAKTVRVFIDACFSGDSDQGMLVRSASPVYVQAVLPEVAGDKLTVLTAASGNEVASWDDEAQHGLFTHHLLDALHGAGDADGDGQVTAAEVKHYLDRTMTRAARREFGRLQNASLNGTAHAVLASAGADGTFRSRPALDGEAPEAVAAVDEEVAVETVESLPGTEEESPQVVRSESPEELEKALGLTRAIRVLVQRGLTALEYDVGPADGLFGKRTRTAVGAYQKAKGFVETGYLSSEQAEALAAVGEEAAQALADAEEKERQRQAEERRKAEEKEQQDRAEEERRADEKAFARAKGRGTAAAYEEYLRTRPDGIHAAEARRVRDEASRVKRAGDVFRDCPECPEMVVVPAGNFRMGSPSHEEGRDDDEAPVHEVRIGRPFAAGVYEVTRGQWSAFVSATGHYTGNACWTYENGEWEERSGRTWNNPGFSQSDTHPVVCVSWDDAQAYVRWLSRKTGETYRLLSESEWEYVARAGTSTSRNWGDSETGQCRYANGADRTLKQRYADWKWQVADCRDGAIHTSAAGTYESNGYGLYDVLGNVWEWTADCWNERYAGAPRDGSAWEGGDCSKRVLRGGSWLNLPWYLRSAYRVRNSTGSRGNINGFRIARTLTP